MSGGSGGAGGPDGNDEFYQQLRLQQLYGEGGGGGEGGTDAFTYVDPADGAAYEWDREKKAWFPKVRHAAGGGAVGPSIAPRVRPRASNRPEVDPAGFGRRGRGKFGYSRGARRGAPRDF